MDYNREMYHVKYNNITSMENEQICDQFEH